MVSTYFPKEIVFYIIEFVTDIDVRRAFGIYRPLPLYRYRGLAYFARTPIQKENYRGFFYTLFEIPNRCNSPERAIQRI